MSPRKPGVEDRPLLSTPTPCRAAHRPDVVEKRAPPRRVAVVVPCLLLLAAVEIGSALVAVPMNQIQEGIMCRERYPNVLASATDARCKGSDVQSALSSLQGWELTFGLVPGLLTAVPYGIAADRYGRRPVLGLSLLGICIVQAVDIVVCESRRVPFPDGTADVSTLVQAASLTSFPSA